jgi:hypothetical protein
MGVVRTFKEVVGVDIIGGEWETFYKGVGGKEPGFMELEGVFEDM